MDKDHRAVWVTWFVLPALLLVISIDVLPAVFALVLSFFRITFFSGGVFVGLANYLAALQDPEFAHSLGVSVIFSFSSVAATMILAMALALIMDKLGTYGVFLLSVILIPWIISRVAAALLWRWMLDASRGGLINYLLSLFSIGPIPFISTDRNAMIALVFVAVWRTVGYALILIFAGLKNIPRQLQNAARIDGASAVFRFLHVTLPLIRHPLLVVLSVLTLSYFNEIGIVIGLTGGGPINATTTLSYLVFRQAHVNYNTGYANALAMVLFLISMSLVMLYYRLLTKKRSY